MPLSVEKQLKGSKDLVEIFADLGKGFGKLFKREKTATDSTHSLLTYGVVYANELARAEIEKERPRFPAGAIIVRERNAAADAPAPDTVIAMVKRENGFSPKTGDWEFFTFDGAGLKLQTRATKGDCAACHRRAEKTDWVFRDYLK